MKALLVEDEKDLMSAMSDYLQQSGMKCEDWKSTRLNSSHRT